MVGDAAEAAAVVAGGVVLRAADFAGSFDERTEDVDVVVGINPLHHAGNPLQPHTGVDVLARQRAEVIRRVADAVELGENQVPDFDRLFSFGVIIDFAAWPADAVGPFAGGAGRPEVVVLPHPLDAARRQADVLLPDAGGFVVVEVNCHAEPVGIDAEPLFRRQKLPGPVDGLPLEVIPEAEVAQHLEKRVVIGGPPHIFDVPRPQALLATGGLRELQLDLAEKVILERVHAGRREQNRRIPAGDQHVAGAAGVPLGLKKGQIFFTQFVGFHGFF